MEQLDALKIQNKEWLEQKSQEWNETQKKLRPVQTKVKKAKGKDATEETVSSGPVTNFGTRG